jgi:hypothetical protein
MGEYIVGELCGIEISIKLFITQGGGIGRGWGMEETSLTKS